MKIPKKIAKQVRECERLRKRVDRMTKELDKKSQLIIKYLRQADESNCDVYIEDIGYVSEPCGDKQGDGEYCNQSMWCEDSGNGAYFYPVEGGKGYVYFTYSF